MHLIHLRCKETKWWVAPTVPCGASASSSSLHHSSRFAPFSLLCICDACTTILFLSETVGHPRFAPFFASSLHNALPPFHSFGAYAKVYCIPFPQWSLSHLRCVPPQGFAERTQVQRNEHSHHFIPLVHMQRWYFRIFFFTSKMYNRRCIAYQRFTKMRKGPGALVRSKKDGSETWWCEASSKGCIVKKKMHTPLVKKSTVSQLLPFAS